MLGAVTDYASSRRGKWVVLLIWIVVAGAIISMSPMLSDISTNDRLRFLPADAESTRAAEMVRDAYPQSTTPAIIVFHAPDGLTDAAMQNIESVYEAITAMASEPESNVAGVVSIFNLPQTRDQLVSRDNTTMMMVVPITGSPTDDAFGERIDALRDVAAVADGEVQVKVSGPAGLIADLVAVFSNVDLFLILVTASLVLVLLILIYRSPVVAVVPLLIVGIVFQLAGAIAALILRAVDVPVDGQTSGIMTVILFGAGTDYYLFIASRYREELRRNADKHLAMRAAMRGVSEAILSAGATLMLAALLLLLATFGSFRSLGPVVAIAIATMMLASITLTPALLTIIGRNGFWPFRPEYTSDAETEHVSRIWSRIGQTVLRRPGAILGGTIVAMLLLSIGLLQYEPSYDRLESLPSNVESVEGFNLLRASFPAGDLAPIDVYLRLPAGASAFDPDGMATVQAVSEALSGVEHVVRVSGPNAPLGLGSGPDADAILAAHEQVPAEVRAQIEQSRGSGQTGPPAGVDTSSPEAQAIGLYTSALQFLSTDLSIARIEVVLDENPYGSNAMDLIPTIREAAKGAADGAGPAGTSVLVGGETAQNADTRSATTHDEWLVLPVILLAIMLVLGLLLRSLIAPLYLGATILLTYFATLGLSLLIFRYVFGHDSIGSTVPFYLFVFVNALGVDYSIYLMSRIREESERMPLGQATEHALERTGGVITSAGIILAGTFAALMTLPLRDLFQLGFAVAVGVLLDTFVTRSLLVPSIVELLGKWNWWPDRKRMRATEQAEQRQPSAMVSGVD
ncbi:MAG: MMPL family transporter [Thermomicrobiales bacterium]|nr:MMPL family transporter [Thermomicrobiales bacterium]